MAKEEKFANYIGEEIYNRSEIKNKMNLFNHMMELDTNLAIHVKCCIELRGDVFYNGLNGDTYIVSKYGITSFNNHSNLIVWHFNEASVIEKFLKMNQIISDNYVAKPPISKTRERMGI